MYKKLLRVILTLTLIMILSGCVKEKAHKGENESLNNSKPNNEIIQKEQSSIEASGISKKDNRKIIEENYYSFLNYDGTFLFREQYDLEGTYYDTYYRVDSKGDILNIYDDGITNMEVFNNYGQSIVSIKRESEKSGDSDLITMDGIIDINGNWIVEQASRILNFRDKFYVIFQEKFDDFGSIGYEPKIINNSGKVLMESPLIEQLSSDNYSGSDSYLILDYKGFVFSSDFFYHDNKIITYEGDITELSINVTDIKKIGSTQTCIYIEKENEVVLINKDGLIDTISILPNMKNITVYGMDIYKYFDTKRDKSIVVYKGEEVHFDFEYEWLIIQSTDEIHPVIVMEVDEDRYKLVTIETSSIVDISKEYYDMDLNFNDFGYIYAREARENGTGGFYTILNDKGEEVITGESKIVDKTGDSNDFLVRIEDNEEIRSFNWVMEKLYNKEELREIFLKNLRDSR